MDLIYYLLIFASCFYFASSTLSIKELKVPDSIKSGSTDEVVLDCNYEAVNETGLVLKWFYNDQLSQIYQWIPETNKHGYASGKFKNNIDLGFKVTDDANAMYRALKIKDISPDMSGNYTCKVSSDTNEVTETKQLIIYTPAKSDLDLVLIEEESVAICTVNGVYPKPNLNLYMTGGNDTFQLINEEVSEIGEDGLYNITTILKYDGGNLTNPTYFVCDLNIPGTNYSLTNNIEHFTGNSGVTSSSLLFPSIFSLVLLLLLK